MRHQSPGSNSWRSDKASSERLCMWLRIASPPIRNGGGRGDFFDPNKRRRTAARESPS